MSVSSYTRKSDLEQQTRGLCSTVSDLESLVSYTRSVSVCYSDCGYCQEVLSKTTDSLIHCADSSVLVVYDPDSKFGS